MSVEEGGVLLLWLVLGCVGSSFVSSMFFGSVFDSRGKFFFEIWFSVAGSDFSGGSSFSLGTSFRSSFIFGSCFVGSSFIGSIFVSVVFVLEFGFFVMGSDFSSGSSFSVGSSFRSTLIFGFGFAVLGVTYVGSIRTYVCWGGG